MSKQVPERFCRFQRDYSSQFKNFFCAIGDRQCSRPVCSYNNANSLPEGGCSIANYEGRFAELILSGLEREGLLV